MESGQLPVQLSMFVILFSLLWLRASAQTTFPSETVLPPSTAEPRISQDQRAVPAELTREIQDTHDFMEDEAATSSFGMVLMEAHGEVDPNGEVQGLLVLDVLPDTPAAKAGLKKMRTGVHTAMAGAAFAASLVFPPALLAAAILQGTHVGESYDLIIGVDSERVRSFEDFSDRMSRARRGEFVYLNISRGGKRLQIPVEVP